MGRREPLEPVAILPDLTAIDVGRSSKSRLSVAQLVAVYERLVAQQHATQIVCRDSGGVDSSEIVALSRAPTERAEATTCVESGPRSCSFERTWTVCA